MRILLIVIFAVIVIGCSSAGNKNVVWYDQAGVAHSVEDNPEQDDNYVQGMQVRPGETADGSETGSDAAGDSDEFSDYIDSEVLASQGFQVEPRERFYTWIDETGFVRNSPMPGAPDGEPIIRQGPNTWTLIVEGSKKLEIPETLRPASGRILEPAQTRKLFQRDHTGIYSKDGQEYIYSLFRLNPGDSGNIYINLRCYEDRGARDNFCEVPEFLLVNEENTPVYEMLDLKANFVDSTWRVRAHYEVALAIPVEDGLSLLSSLPAGSQGDEWFIQLLRDEK